MIVVHTGLTMYYVRLLFYDIIKVAIQFIQSFFTKSMFYNMKCIGTVKSFHIETSILRKETLTELYCSFEHVPEKLPTYIINQVWIRRKKKKVVFTVTRPTLS